MRFWGGGGAPHSQKTTGSLVQYYATRHCLAGYKFLLQAQKLFYSWNVSIISQQQNRYNRCTRGLSSDQALKIINQLNLLVHYVEHGYPRTDGITITDRKKDEVCSYRTCIFIFQINKRWVWKWPIFDKSCLTNPSVKTCSSVRASPTYTRFRVFRNPNTGH